MKNQTKQAQKLTQLSEITLQFCWLEQWYLHTSLTNIKAAAVGERRGRWGGRPCPVQIRDKRFLSARLLCCLQQRQCLTQWHAREAKQKDFMRALTIEREPENCYETQRQAVGRFTRLSHKKKKKHGWQKEEFEKEWWRTLNLLSFSITQWRSVATACKVTDGDKNPCLTR